VAADGGGGVWTGGGAVPVVPGLALPPPPPPPPHADKAAHRTATTLDWVNRWGSARMGFLTVEPGRTGILIKAYRQEPERGSLHVAPQQQRFLNRSGTQEVQHAAWPSAAFTSPIFSRNVNKHMTRNVGNESDTADKLLSQFELGLRTKKIPAV
jgi:hypothetical protein